MAGISCARPDVVLRSDSTFSKSSSILLTVGIDNAIFKPELEKALLRQGFNVISDRMAHVVLEERKSRDVRASVPGSQRERKAERTDPQDSQEPPSSHSMKADFLGKIEYLYKPGKHTVSRLNLTIVDSQTGSIVASLCYERSGTNTAIAKAVAAHLESAIGPGEGFR